MKERKRVFAKKPSGNCRVRHEFKEDADIVSILKKVRKGIPVNWLNRRTPNFMDLSEMPRDLHSVFQVAAAAQEAFMELPALMREELGNDPARVGEISEPMLRKHGLWREADSENVSAIEESESETQVSKTSKKISKPASQAKSKEAESDDA